MQPKKGDSPYLVALKAHSAWIDVERKRIRALFALVGMFITVTLTDVLEPGVAGLVVAAIALFALLAWFVHSMIAGDRAFVAADAAHDVLEDLCKAAGREIIKADGRPTTPTIE